MGAESVSHYHSYQRSTWEHMDMDMAMDMDMDMDMDMHVVHTCIYTHSVVAAE